MSTELTTSSTADAVMAALAEPFDPAEVKWKPQVVKGDRALAVAYIDARVVQDRLDQVFGVAGWKSDFERVGEHSVMCRLSVRIDGEWITRTDVGSTSEQPDAGDKMKAAFSDALKRAAVTFGVGRYLYRLGMTWTPYDSARKQFTQVPTMPKWALPSRQTHVHQAPAKQLPAQQQQPAIEAAKPQAKFAAEDNKRARAAAVAAYAACPDVDAFRTISQQVKADAERGIFSQADLDAIRDVARQTSDRLRQASLPPQTAPQSTQEAPAAAIPPERVSVADLQQMIHKKKLPADVVELEAVLRLVQAAVGQEQSVDLDELISQEVEGSDGVPVEMWTKKQVKAGWSAIQNWVRGLPPAGKLIGEPAATNLPG